MAYQGRKPEFPKPYDFVPFADRVDKQYRTGHEAYPEGRLSGQFDYMLRAESFLHVSSGSYALTEDLGMETKNVIRDLYRVYHEGEQKPAIPGSSIKGAVRSIVEAVTESCIGSTRVFRRDLPKDLARTCSPPWLCPACAIFGAMNRMSRVGFNDAVFLDGRTGVYFVPPLFGPRPRQGRKYKDRSRKFIGRKFYFHGKPARHQDGQPIEVLAVGSRLESSLTFTGLTESELGLLLYGLGLSGSFQPALGAGKPLAMGRVSIIPGALRFFHGDSFTAYDDSQQIIDGEQLQDSIERYIGEAEPHILSEQRKKLEEILDPENEREAPTGTY